MPKRTFQPKKMRRIKRLGFMSRNSTPGGKNVIKRRIDKGRKRLSVSDEFRLLKKKPRSKIR